MKLRWMLAACLLLAASARAQDDRRSSALSALEAQVARYLGSPAVRSARPAVAVIAVRGGAPQDLGEDLDARLLDRALALRSALLAGKAAADDLAQLRGVYAALAVSYWAQALGQQPSADTAAQAHDALRRWVRERAGLPQSLGTALSSAEAGFDEKKLVAAGWGPYCRSITPARDGASAEGESSSRTFDAATAKLDELLEGLRKTWTGKSLSPQEKAEAFLLAGQTTLALSRAPFEVRRVAAASPASAATAVSVATAAQRPTAPSQASEADFSPKTIYDKASRSIVLIMASAPEAGAKAGEIGSGSVIDARGRVLTNAHVVIREATREPWPQLHVYFKPARMTGDPAKDLVNPVSARLLAYDASLDLALLDVGTPPAGVGVLSFDDPAQVQVGDRVAAIGHPEQGGLWTLTTGIVSAFVAELGGVAGRAGFQTDASINRGNSGGPLLDAAARIVGVNTLMSRKAADGLAITAVNFAIRADVAQRWLAEHGESLTTPTPVPAPEPVEPVKIVSQPSRPAPARPSPPARPIKAPSAAKPPRVVITESKPYDPEELLRRQMKDLDDMGQEMEKEIDEHRAQ